MAGLGAVFDSDVVIDFLHGVLPARDELFRYSDTYISGITWVEAQVKVPAHAAEAVAAALGSNFKVIPIDQAVLAETLNVRRRYKLKLPDAIILASARTRGLTLVTRNTKEFPPTLPGIRIPYTLKTP